jgi:hypothetical protein
MSVAPRKPLQRKRRHACRFGSITEEDLADRRFDEVFSATTRLFIHLQIKSHWGRHDVKLSNDVAAGIGITRQRKQECLRQLERCGLVAVERDGQKVPVVTLVQRTVR